MLCPDCGKEISEDDNYCPQCGFCLKEKNVKKLFSLKSIGFILILIFIIIVALYSYLAKVGSTINLDDANIPEILPKADSCSSPYVENEVMSLFKDSDPFFNNIEQKSISSVKLLSKETISTNETSSKYICSGVIEILSNSKGFRPLSYDENNSYYHKVFIDYDDTIITRYTSYELPVFYTSQIIDGKNQVEISEIGIGEFTCKGICSPIQRYYKKIEPAVIHNEPIINANENLENLPVVQNNIQSDTNNQVEVNEIKKEKKKRKFKLFKRNKRTET